MMRLQKFLALSGVASRRKSEELIRGGHVMVNGTIVKEMGTTVDPDRDYIKVDNKLVRPENRKVYILLNKPSGVVTTSSDQFQRETVLDLLGKKVVERVFPVGRLDYETEGLLLLTNDGDLANRIMHPKTHLPKRYQVVVRGKISKENLEALAKGVNIGDYVTTEAEVKLIAFRERKTEIEMTINEGKNRQIRRMMEAIGHEVAYLKRIAIGPIFDSALKKGAWRPLTDEELKRLNAAVEKQERLANRREKDKITDAVKDQEAGHGNGRTYQKRKK